MSGCCLGSCSRASLSEASNSLISNANLINKVYFPRLIVPAAAGVVALVDFTANLAILFGLMAWYGFLPNRHVVFLPVFIAFAIIASLGPALYITALNVKYRDVRYIIPFIVQFGLYVSPVGFSSDVIPEQMRFWYSLNPVVGVIDGFRWCLLGGSSKLYMPGFLASLGVTTLMLWYGLRYFRAHRARIRGSCVERAEEQQDERRCHSRRRARQEIRHRTSHASASATRRCAMYCQEQRDI